MTNEVNYTPIKYACNGATDSFSFQWKIIAASDLIVILEDETTKEQITLIDGVDYMLYQDIVGGYIVTTNKYPQGKNIILSREVSQYQDKTYSSSSGFQAKEIEESFDKLSANVQDLKYTLDRALKVPVGSGALGLELPENLVDKNTITWDAAKQKFVNFDVVGEIDSFEQEIGADVDTFKSSINQTLQQNKQNTDADISNFKQSVNSEISSFKQAVNSQIETFEQEVESDVDSFKNTTNQTIQQNKENTDADILSFKQSVNSEISTFKEEQQNAYDEFIAGVDEKIEKVSDAAGKIDELEESVTVAVKAAEDATNAAEQLTGALESFVTKEELDEAVENVDVDLTGYIKNKEAISGAISIGNTTSAVQSTTVGGSAYSAKNGSSFGYSSRAEGQNSVALGYKAQTTGASSIQIGEGTNAIANSLQVNSYPLMNLSTGKIYADRLEAEYITLEELEEALKGVGGGLHIGTIIPVTASSSHVPENTLYCDGTEFSGAEGQMFRNLWTDYILTGLLDTCSYSEYQTELTMTGSCWRWAVDTVNQKFRIPFIPNKVLTDVANTVDVKGNGMTLGLTNGTQKGGLDYGNEYAQVRTGTYGSNIGTTATGAVIGEAKSIGVTKDSTKSGIIADTTNAKTYKTIRHYVVVATGSINQSEMDWSAWASSLANKANVDLSNVTQSSGLRRLIEVSGSSLMPSWYKVFEETNPQTGEVLKWCEQGGFFSSSVNNNNSTVTFLKPFKDTNYDLQVTSVSAEGFGFALDKTRVSVRILVSGGDKARNWRACGYIN